MKKSGIIFYSILTVMILASLKAFAGPNYSYKVYTPAPYVSNNTVNDTNADVIQLVADYSGSMDKWMTLTQRLMQGILPQIPAKTKVGLRAFGYLPKLNNTETNRIIKKHPGRIAGIKALNAGGACRVSTQIVPSYTNNTKPILSAMELIKAGGDTPLTYSLEETVYKDFMGMSLNTKKKIVLITDGNETCLRSPCNFVKKLVKTRKDIQIDVILVGGGSKLQCLSDATGGLYRRVSSESEFNSAINASFGTKPQTYPSASPSKPHYEFMD